MVRYEQNKDEFILEDYDRAKTFSDFMPAIAGVSGIPLWVYFVNRGQCVCSIGVNDKNNSITEFMPANKALLNVERLGFRTFVKAGGRCAELYADKSTPKKLVSSNNRLTVCDTLEGFLSAEVTYTQLAWQNIPALMRRLKLTNLGKETIEVNCTDGLAQIVPNGINDYQLKNVSNLSCAYSNAVYSNGLIKYQVEYTTADHAKVSKNRGANFYCSAASSGEKPFYIYDPDLVFGSDCALTRAEKLFSSTEEELRAANQAVVFKMATAFSMYDFKLAPGESAEIYSAVGSVKDEAKLSEVASVFSGAEAFEREMRRSGRVIEEITKEIGIRTGDGLFDQYVRQSFVDNVLRGGMPVRIRGKKGGEVIHYVYSRKHGDLEREYNWFVVPATKYSGGTGNYRDLCQNRRSDVIFFPFVGDYNIKMFYSFLQLDGYNPLVIKQPVRPRGRRRALCRVRKIRRAAGNARRSEKRAGYQQPCGNFPRRVPRRISLGVQDGICGGFFRRILDGSLFVQPRPRGKLSPHVPRPGKGTSVRQPLPLLQQRRTRASAQRPARRAGRNTLRVQFDCSRRGGLLV